MKTSKKLSRKRRGGVTRGKLRAAKSLRLTINRTPRHTYAQIIQSGDEVNTSVTDKVLVSASTLEKAFVEKKLNAGNVDAAKQIGQLIAEKAKAAGITKVAFDRSGFKYHGRVKALADAAREHGLEF